MDRIAIRIAAGELDPVLDRLLVLFPQGVHVREDGDHAELSAFGERPPALAEIEAAVGDAAIGAIERVAAPTDWRERRRLYGRGLTIGSVHVRSEFDPPPGADETAVDVVLRVRESTFGGGAHVTTQMMLLMMDELAPDDGGFGDLGCGTGALAIAAAKRGWSPVVALDYRADSVEATSANAELNGVAIDVAEVDLASAPPPALRTLAANIPPAVHRNVAASLDPAVQTVLATGLMTDDAQDTVARYVAAGLEPTAEQVAANWTAVRLDRRPEAAS